MISFDYKMFCAQHSNVLISYQYNQLLHFSLSLVDEKLALRVSKHKAGACKFPDRSRWELIFVSEIKIYVTYK